MRNTTMIRYLCVIPLLQLLYDFYWWFNFAKEKGAIPTLGMVVVNIIGIALLAALIIEKEPKPIVAKTFIAWCALYLICSLANFQAFGFNGITAAWFLPGLFFAAPLLPAVFRSYGAIKNA